MIVTTRRQTCAQTRAVMSSQARPKSSSVDEDGDVEMSGTTGTDRVMRNRRPTKKQRTKANMSYSEDAKTVEAPRTRTVMVRVEGKSKFFLAS